MVRRTWLAALAVLATSSPSAAMNPYAAWERVLPKKFNPPQLGFVHDHALMGRPGRKVMVGRKELTPLTGSQQHRMGIIDFVALVPRDGRHVVGLIATDRGENYAAAQFVGAPTAYEQRCINAFLYDNTIARC